MDQTVNTDIHPINIVKVIIEQTENNLGAYLEGIDGIVTTGSNIDEIKSNIAEALEQFIEISKEFGDEIPVVLQGNYELTFEKDVRHNKKRFSLLCKSYI